MSIEDAKLVIGLIVNPLAGIGGPAGLKGSDGVYDEAIALGASSQISSRVATFLQSISSQANWYTLPGSLGADYLKTAAIDCKVIGEPISRRTTAADTVAGVAALSAAGVDLLLFAGGDGTARDVLDADSEIPAVLGIPCGVKMHSGVFATSPKAAAEIINKVLRGELLSRVMAEVRDIDEASFRDGVVNTQYYGELPVPEDLRYLQQTKIGGRESDELVLQEIAADFIDHMEPETTYLMGSGSTVLGIMESLGLEGTLLGIDVVRDGKLLECDASEQMLLTLLETGIPAEIVVTAISGQGHIFGRGNQQLSPAVIRRVGLNHIRIVATKLKLQQLEQRPLLVDTGDVELDALLTGLWPVTTGYEDQVFVQVAS